MCIPFTPRQPRQQAHPPQGSRQLRGAARQSMGPTPPARLGPNRTPAPQAPTSLPRSLPSDRGDRPSWPIHSSDGHLKTASSNMPGVTLGPGLISDQPPPAARDKAHPSPARGPLPPRLLSVLVPEGPCTHVNGMGPPVSYSIYRVIDVSHHLPFLSEQA